MTRLRARRAYFDQLTIAIAMTAFFILAPIIPATAIVTGSKTGYILRKYMLPNVIPTLVITAATDIGGMMLELAGLSFLGFGAKAPAAEWGLMLNEGRTYMQNAPWMMIYPGLAIFIVVVIFNLLGDSLRDVLDVREE